MNLLKNSNKIEQQTSGIPLNKFRQVQYDNLRYFIELAVNYLSKQNDNYLKINKITINKLSDYIGVYSNFVTQVTVEVINLKQNSTEIKTLFKILVPTLINDSFFILNGNYYIPTLYIVDKPIVMKKKSIKLSSLFNSISIYNKLATFIGINIPVSHLLNLLLSDDDADEKTIKNDFCDYFDIKLVSTPESDLIRYFSEKFRCDPTKEAIIKFIDNIFFDEYTKYLYQYCHNIPENEITIKNIVIKALQKRFNINPKDFIDLTQKRIVFLETLLLPLFKRIGVHASQVAKGFTVDTIKIDQMEIIKFFHNKLHNKFIYDSVNAYSGMLAYKVSMLNPGSENAPSIVADLHETHFQKICPISISNQNPGETTYITPVTELDYLGQFTFLNTEVNKTI